MGRAFQQFKIILSWFSNRREKFNGVTRLIPLVVSTIRYTVVWHRIELIQLYEIIVEESLFIIPIPYQMSVQVLDS